MMVMRKEMNEANKVRLSIFFQNVSVRKGG